MISGTNLVLMIMILTLLIVNIRKNGFNLKAAILLVGFINTMYIFIHYGLENRMYRRNTFFIIEVFRYTMQTLLCYYYTQKATGLLDNRKDILCFLRMFLILGTVMIVIGTIYLELKLLRKDKYDLCHSTVF